MLKEQVRKYLSAQCSRKVVRRILESDEPYAREVWQGLAGMGLTGAAIPEQYGGVGLGHYELCVTAEELGRALAPVPFSSSVYLATEAILAAGSATQKQEYLPGLAAGRLIGTLAHVEGAGATTAQSLQTRYADGCVTGVKLPVPDGDIADFAVVAARSGESADSPVSLLLVDLHGKGVTRQAIETIDPTRSQARIVFDKAPAQLLGEAGQGWDVLQDVLNRAAVLIAFEQLGGASEALVMATDYAQNRMAFGRQIGSFQAIKHKLAEMYMRIEIARSNCYYGAYALATGAADLPLAAASCRVAASDAFDYAARENQQTHGGNGFTWQFDCQLFYRRARLLALTLGSQKNWKNRLVTALENLHPAEEARHGFQ